MPSFVMNSGDYKWPILGFWQKIVKEEDRLAAVVADIDHEVRIVPRGAFIRTPTGKVVPNRSYSGKKKERIS